MGVEALNVSLRARKTNAGPGVYRGLSWYGDERYPEC